MKHLLLPLTRGYRSPSSCRAWLMPVLGDHMRRVASYQNGLTASLTRVEHGVIVRAPVSLMVTPGEYLFVVHAVDDHPDEEKVHRRKSALPLACAIPWPVQIPMPSLTGLVDVGSTGLYGAVYPLGVLQPDQVVEIPIMDTCPPSARRPKPGDLNGDGRLDWDYPGDVQIPGTGWCVGLFGIDKPEPRGSLHYRDEYRLCIGRDLDGNQRLDITEVIYSIGKCPWARGMNKGWMERYGSEWYVHWVSEAPPLDGDNKTHFIYKESTNWLRVWERVNGQTRQVFEGSPNAYHW